MAAVPYPLLLAGPILRKVTATDVYVWVATSQACTVTVDVYGAAAVLNRGAHDPTGTVTTEKAGSGSRATVKVGASLHIAVVRAQIVGVPPETVCSYNVTLDSGGGRTDLGGLKLLDLGDPTDDYQGGLGFAEGQLPGFVSPPEDIANLRLMHGSCFGLKGAGHSIMPEIDDLIGDAIKVQDGPPPVGTADEIAAQNALKRPHMLLLTGDQIYSDDVATSLLPCLTSIGATLLAGDEADAKPETVPVDGISDPVEMTQDNFPAGRRLKLVRATAGMTTDDGDDHLIGFGEFAAMYLLSWTGRLDNRLPDGTTPIWPTATELGVLPTNPLTDPAVITDPAVTPRGPVVLRKAQTTGKVEALLTPLLVDPSKPGFTPRIQQEVAENFNANRRDMVKAGDDGDHVRRALANVPVLTICDDHEVTDDWFITGAWRARVLASTLGRAIIRNALLAYVLFQAWGNTPEAFDEPDQPEGKLLALVPTLFDPETTPDALAAAHATVDNLLGLDDPTGTGAAPRVAFNYHVDLGGARLVVLDTRNHREYGTPNGPPGLLTQAALDAQLPIALTDDVPVLIVVSPAPVLGPRLMEEIAVPLVTHVYDFQFLAGFKEAKSSKTEASGYDRKQPIGDLYIDVEHWAGRPVAFERFLARISRCPRVVILAGDVHYAASFGMDYQRFDVPAVEGGVPPADPPPASSSSRIVNFTSSAFRNEWPWYVPLLVRNIGIMENLERVGFDGLRLGWTRMDPPVLTAGDLAANEARTLQARLHREPVMLPTIGWRSEHSIRPPEWAYRLNPISDTRTDDVRFADLADLGFTRVLAPDVEDAFDPPPDGSTTESWVADGGPYSTAASLHAANVEGGAITRTLVFQNDVGVVTFRRDSPTGPLSVQMAIYFVRAHPISSDEKPHAYVVHATTLEPSPLTAPANLGGEA